MNKFPFITLRICGKDLTVKSPKKKLQAILKAVTPNTKVANWTPHYLLMDLDHVTSLAWVRYQMEDRMGRPMIILPEDFHDPIIQEVMAGFDRSVGSLTWATEPRFMGLEIILWDQIKTPVILPYAGEGIVAASRRRRS